MYFNQSSIVFLGNFNPSIFHPEWFNRYKILPIQETQWSEGEQPKQSTILEHDGRKIIIREVPPLIVRPDLSDLYFRSLRIFVNPERYECTTQRRENFSLTREVTVKTFRLLPHTPVTAFGINFEGHFKFEKDTQVILRDMFSKRDDRMKEALGREYEISGHIKSRDHERTLTITLDKSAPMENGLYCGVNIHRDIPSRQAGDAVELLASKYDSDLGEAIDVFKNLLGEPEDIWEPKELK